MYKALPVNYNIECFGCFELIFTENFLPDIHWRDNSFDEQPPEIVIFSKMNVSVHGFQG
jgi:hypothetical protein